MEGLIQGFLLLAGSAFITALWPLFPIRPSLMAITYGVIWNPFLVAAFVTFGGTLASLLTYGVSYEATELKAAKKVMENKYIKWFLKKLEKSMFLLIFLTLVTPIPDGIVGLAGGADRYSMKKFLAINIFFRMIIYTTTAYFGSYYKEQFLIFWHWFLGLFM